MEHIHSWKIGNATLICECGEILPIDKMDINQRRVYYEQVIQPPTGDVAASSLWRVRWLYKEIPALKPKRILEIGCESGFITRWVVDEPYVEELKGIDPCVNAINHAKTLVLQRKHPEKATYTTEAWEALDESRSWDAIVCFELIEHFPSQEGDQLIAKIHRLLSHGGSAFLCTPSPNGRYGVNNPDKHHLYVYTEESLRGKILANTGYDPSSNKSDVDFLMQKWSKP